MPDPNSEHGPSHKPGTNAIRSAHGRTRGLRLVLLIKLLVLAAIVASFWLLELQFEIGATALILLHLAVGGALLVLAWRSGILGKRGI